MTSIRDLKKQWMEDPEFRAEYDALEGEYAMTDDEQSYDDERPYDSVWDAIIKEGDTVEMMYDLPDKELKAGDRGDVTRVHDNGHGGFDVAFFSTTIWIGSKMLWLPSSDNPDARPPTENELWLRCGEAIYAARDLLPFLHTSSDDAPSRSSSIMMDAKLTRAERLRAEADHIEAEEAAIWRLRRALDAFVKENDT